MKKILNILFEQKKLSKNQSKEVLINIAKNKYNTSQIAAFITIFLMRPISVDEISGFQEALLELAIKIDLHDFNTIDLCGTGGDEKNTFNISTITSFIVAICGYKVAKHGNYGVSSASGSSNILQCLGYKFTNNENILKKQLDIANICFLHAPMFHPAMKIVAPIRNDLGVKTFFNMLGPLVNPSQPKNQLLGVFNLEVARVYNYILQLNKINYSVIHSLDGFDEISLTDNFKIYTKDGEKQISPYDLHQKKIKQEDLYGGNTIAQALKIFKNIINGKVTNPQNNVVLTNASFAIQIMDKTKTFETAFEEAKQSLLGGKTKKILDLLISNQ